MMTFVEPLFPKGRVNRAGEILIAPHAYSEDERLWADQVLANWRAAHAYPINTFQPLLRSKLKSIGSKAIVAQRLKTSRSIISKLKRFENMQLSRMQDIGGLRAVVDSVSRVRKLQVSFYGGRFKHVLVENACKDYILEPKADGYRGIHLIYRYCNPRAPAYEGLSIELQIRTRLQHAWATAVETTGTFLGQALKSGQGEKDWRDFFANASAAIALHEKAPPVPGFEDCSADQVHALLAAAEKKLNVLEKLNGFAIAADKITTESGQGGYHLVVLDSESRTVSIRPYPLARLEEANNDYMEVERRAKAGERIEPVLVSAGPISALRKAYPNYFLDTQVFVAQMNKVIASVPVTRRSHLRTKVAT